MSPPFRVGLSLPVPPDVGASVAHAEWAEARGFDDVWLADTGGQDALTLAAAVACNTRRVRIGTAVIGAYTRTPAVLASTAMTLSHLAPDRFVLGLGASSHAMVENWHGLPFEKPLSRVRETALVVRQALSGMRTDFDGETLRSHGFRLNPPAAGTVPIVLAGLRPRMLRMAGQYGDGVVLNLFPYEVLPRLLEQVALGVAQAGSAGGSREIVCRHQVCVTDRPEEVRERFRRHFAPYYATPVYNRFLAWCGYEEAAAAIEAGWQARDREATTAALTDELVDRIAVIGDADACRARIRELAHGGIHTNIIACFSDDEAEQRATYEAFCPERFQLR